MEPEEGKEMIEPDPDLVDRFEEFEVETILDSRVGNTMKFYLVKWKGYSEIHNSWKPEENITNCNEIMSECLRTQDN